MTWREVDIVEAFRWALSRQILCQYKGTSGWPEEIQFSTSASGLIFTDGSIIATGSYWCGPYSEVTPDIEIMPPTFWIGTTP